MVADLYDWLMLVHIIAAMVWLGGLVALIVLATQAVRSGESDVVARFVANLRVTGLLLFLPAMALVLGLGIWSSIAAHGALLRAGSDCPLLSSRRPSW
jgi:uncharacterized membrane protein